MKLRKISADQIFDGYRFHHSAVLLIADDGRIEDLIKDGSVEADEHHSGILVPGFINCHCHLELSHMKGLLPRHTGLVDFVLRIITGRHFEDEVILKAIREGEEEMMRNGIVAVGDICNNSLTIPQKREGHLSYYNFIEVSGWNPGIARARYLRSRDFYEEYARLQPFASMVPHAPYSVSEELWQLMEPEFNGKIITIHNQETAAENEFFQKGTGDFNRLYQQLNIPGDHFMAPGTTSLHSYYHRFKGADGVILVHNSFITEGDLDYINSLVLEKRAPHTFFCLCINANLYIENRVPPIDQLRTTACSIVLGTDSLASNDALDILGEMRSIHKHFPHIPSGEILRWATLNGARALSMDDQFGSFEKGKTPGCILIDDEFKLLKKIL